MADVLAAGMVDDEPEYDILIDALAEASGRFGAQQKAVIELRHLCASRVGKDVQSEQVLEVLERHGL